LTSETVIAPIFVELTKLALPTGNLLFALPLMRRRSPAARTAKMPLDDEVIFDLVT
jgi:hypothetical protein